MARLHDSNKLGSFPDREEFQVGQVIVWVKIPPHGNRATWLERANSIFEQVWPSIPAVISAAELVSRTLVPEFWKAYDQAGAADNPLSVQGIWIDSASGSADYEVSRNHDFDRASLPELPDDHSIMVSRDPNGGVRAR